MSKESKYSFKIPLFTQEAESIWKDMPNIIKGLVTKKKEATEKFNRLDAIVNNGELKRIGTAFGFPIYTRINNSDKDMAEYQSKRLSAFMAAFNGYDTEEFIIDGKKYTVLLKEDIDKGEWYE